MYNWSRTRFQALPIINTQFLQATEKIWVVEDSENKRKKGKERKKGEKNKSERASQKKKQTNKFWLMRMRQITGRFFVENRT